MAGDAHFGDWGFQMGLLIVAVGDEGKAELAGNRPHGRAQPNQIRACFLDRAANFGSNLDL